MSLFKNHWKQFCSLIPTAALVFLDQTILPVALPTIRLDMHASETSLQWAVNAYVLAIAVLVLVGGKLSDWIGHKKILMLGMFIFVLSSIFCSLSQEIWMLIAARALQGVGGALMFPAQTSMITLIFPPEKRGRAIGTIVSIGSLFLVLGPLVGGYLIKVASWHWIFWINLPIGAIGLWMIYHFLPDSEKRAGKIDLLGFLFFTLAVGSLTVLIMEGATWGIESLPSIILLIISVIGLILLFYRETKASHPFLDLSLFRNRVFAAININITIIQFFLMITVLRSIYFQDILEYTPLQTGYLMFASGSPLLFMAPLAGYLSDRFTPKLPIAIGYLSLIFSSFIFGFNSLPNLPVLLLAQIAFGMGIPLIFTPSFSSGLSAVPKTKVGSAAGVITTLRMTGGALGLALIHFLATKITLHYLPTLGQRDADIKAFSHVHFTLAFMLLITFAITFILHTRKSAHHLPEAPAEGWD